MYMLKLKDHRPKDTGICIISGKSRVATIIQTIYVTVFVKAHLVCTTTIFLIFFSHCPKNGSPKFQLIVVSSNYKLLYVYHIINKQATKMKQNIFELPRSMQITWHIQLSIASLSNFSIKTCVFLVACIILQFFISFFSKCMHV